MFFFMVRKLKEKYDAAGLMMNMAKCEYLIAVSYTHLDVYKRQTLTSAHSVFSAFGSPDLSVMLVLSLIHI